VNPIASVRFRVIAMALVSWFRMMQARTSFLSEREMSRVMHGDRVKVRVMGTDRRGRPEGQIVEVITHVNRLVIGRLLNENGVLIVAPEDKRIGHDILIPPKGQLNAKLGQVVSVEIIDYPDSYRQAVGRVVEVLGEIDDPGMEIEIAVRKYGVPHEFSAATMKESAALPDGVVQADLEGRVDLRDVPLVTIDGADARDFDDAVYCEPTMFGKVKAWRLIVAIADVSHYVKPGNALDEEGLLRATSVYFSASRDSDAARKDFQWIMLFKSRVWIASAWYATR
jgi:ribonuclease R